MPTCDIHSGAALREGSTPPLHTLFRPARLMRRCLPLLLLCGALLCFMLSHAATDRLGLVSDLAVLRNAGGQTAFDYTGMGSRERAASLSTDFALFDQADRRVITTLTGRRAEVALLTVRGDTRLVLPVSATLSPEDMAGCLLDEQTAFRLTGGGSAVGATVTLGGQDYVIRGVFPAPKATMVIQAAPGASTPLPHVVLRDIGRTDSFLMRHGLSPTLQVNGHLYHRAAGCLTLLPVATALVLLVITLFRLRKRHRDYPVRTFLIGCLLAALLTAAFIGLLTLVPGDYVPSRWSDFSFWSDTAERFMDDTGDYLAAAKLRPDLLMIRWTAGALWGIPSALLLVLSYRGFRKNRTGPGEAPAPDAAGPPSNIIELESIQSENAYANA